MLEKILKELRMISRACEMNGQEADEEHAKQYASWKQTIDEAIESLENYNDLLDS